MKDKETKVYIVTSGCYSDYSYDGIFSSRENAEEFMRRFPLECANCDEVTLDNAIPFIREGLAAFQVTMLRDGTTENVWRYDGFENKSHHIWRRTQAPAYRGKGVPDALQATVWAKDEQHAVKIANEIRGRMIAHGEWPQEETA